MCGFAGDAGLSAAPKEREAALLDRMGAVLSARGPDAQTRYTDDVFRVVFRRLAVNDLAGGGQPFRSADGRLTVVVHGEIYNHAELARHHLAGVRLRSRCDCEVVLHLFEKLGTAAFAELNGMFAIAVWDAATRRLVLARDRLGIKPLYYAELGDRLAFASELRALLVRPEVPRALDWAALRAVPDLSFPYQRPAGRVVPSGVEGVELVRPGCHVEWRAGRPPSTTRYWEPAGPDGANDTGTADEWVERYADLLADSVRLQLMSDVPVGVFLSGGVDSALLTSIAARHDGALEAFTLVEPSIDTQGDPAAAREVAREIGLPLHAVRVDADALAGTIGFGLDTLEYLVSIMDSPTIDPEIIFKHELHRYVAATRPDTKVILLGQGADEFAGGYSHLGPAGWAGWTRREAASLREARARHIGVPAAFTSLVSARVTDATPVDLPPALPHWQAARLGDLPAFNLWHEDRTAAANGRESRVPFLDHRIVELLCSVPEHLHETLFDDKRIGRLVAERYLPARIAHRPKVPMYGSGPAGPNSIRRLRKRLVDASFDDFREEYLRAGDSLFEEDRIVALRERATGGHKGEPLIHLLVRCMAISIFERSCRSLADPGHRVLSLRGRPVAPRTPDPRLAASPESAEPGRYRLAGDVQLAVASPVLELLVVVGSTVLGRVRLGPGASGAHLDRLLSSEALDATEFAAAFGLDEARSGRILASFLAESWLVPCPTSQECAL